MKIYVNNRGWVMGVRHKNGDVVELFYTKHRVGAMPFKGDWIEDPEALDVLRYIESVLQSAYTKYQW